MPIIGGTVASTDARRLTFDSFPSWPFCIYLRISTEEILETRKSRGWTRILALLETSTTSPAPSFSCPTSSLVSFHKRYGNDPLTNLRGAFQYCLEEGESEHLAVVLDYMLGNRHDVHGSSAELPRPRRVPSDSRSIRGKWHFLLPRHPTDP